MRRGEKKIRTCLREKASLRQPTQRVCWWRVGEARKLKADYLLSEFAVSPQEKKGCFLFFFLFWCLLRRVSGVIKARLKASQPVVCTVLPSSALQAQPSSNHYLTPPHTLFFFIILHHNYLSLIKSLGNGLKKQERLLTLRCVRAPDGSPDFPGNGGISGRPLSSQSSHARGRKCPRELRFCGQPHSGSRPWAVGGPGCGGGHSTTLLQGPCGRRCYRPAG